MQIDLNEIERIKDSGNHEWQVYLAAKYYASQGMYVIPIRENSKFLPTKDTNINYGSASKNQKVIDGWFHPTEGRFIGWNVGLAAGREGGIFAIDIDRHGSQDGFMELNKILEKETEDKELIGPYQVTPNKGEHHIFIWQENAASSTGKIAPGIDTRGGTEKSCKSHIVVWPSIIGGVEYKWNRGGEVLFIPKWALTKLGVMWKPRKYSSKGNENVSQEDMEKQVPADQIERMISAINPDDVDYETWLKIGQAINTQLPTDVGLQMWDKWSSTGKRYKNNECSIRWHGFDPTGPVRCGSLFYYAKQSGWEPAEDDISISKNIEIVEKLNAQFAIVVVGGKIKVLREKDNVRDPILGHYDLLDKESFRTLMLNDVTEWVDGGGKVKKVSVADLWLASDIRRTYPNGMRLMPDKKGNYEGCYNTWNGFSVTPREGDCKFLLDHILKVICNGDTDIYNWVIDWCADSVQDPANPKGTCIVMRGQEGAGKGTLANTMGELFGSHYRHLIDDSHLLSNFNAHMIDAVFVFADEITWGGNQKTSGKLKGMVTEEWLVGERKGVDAVGYRNVSHMMIASNSKWVIPAGTKSRRWCVLDVNDSRIGDVQYFDNIIHSLNNGGKEAFLHYLLERNITNNLRKAPHTKGLEDQEMMSIRQDSIADWWMHTVLTGSMETADLKDDSISWPNEVITAELYNEYTAFCEKKKTIPHHLVVFGKDLMRFGISRSRPRVHGDRKRASKIPPLDWCIESIQDIFGIDIGD